MPVESEGSAEERIRSISRKYHDATHNCYAYRIGTGGRELVRSSDAGEPSGTAGRPILETIQARGLTDTLVVVTRYFGGTRLGTGGLARAYHETAAGTLALARISERYLTARLRIRFPYDHTGQVMRLLTQMEADIRETAYDTEAMIVCEVRLSRKEELRRAVRDATAGKAETGDA